MAAHVCASSGAAAAISSQVSLSSPAIFLLAIWCSSQSNSGHPSLVAGCCQAFFHRLCCHMYNTASHCVQDQVCPHLYLLWNGRACMCSWGSAFCRGVIPCLNHLQVNLWETEPTKAWQLGPLQDQQAGCSIQTEAMLPGSQR